MLLLYFVFNVEYRLVYRLSKTWLFYVILIWWVFIIVILFYLYFLFQLCLFLLTEKRSVGSFDNKELLKEFCCAFSYPSVCLAYHWTRFKILQKALS